MKTNQKMLPEHSPAEYETVANHSKNDDAHN